jgi:dienelactone hydrolase
MPAQRRSVLLAVLAVLAVVAVSASATVIRWPNADASTNEVAHKVSVVEYNLGDTAFTDGPDWDGRSELAAVVHYPSDLPARAPLVVQLHGQAYTCATDDPDASWPCPPGVKSVPSYRGYDYLGEALARRGFVIVSLSANGINAFVGTSTQRAHLINRHLAMWQQLAATGRGPLADRFTDPATGRNVTVDFRGRVDMRRVGTMGHSVGGLAVMRQAADRFHGDWPDGVTIRAVAPIASVYFEENEGDNSDTLITKIPFAVLSAECWRSRDRQYFDNARGQNKTPAYLITIKGANHSFLNTQWAPSSGQSGASDDSNCPDNPAKLSETTERRAAVEYLTAFYESTLHDNHRYDTILTGARPLTGVSSLAEYLK